MNMLPREIEDIIYNYAQQLNNEDVKKELLDNKYHCSCCYDLKFTNVTKIVKKCGCCTAPICYECTDNFVMDNPGNLCNDCFYIEEISIISTLIINRDLIEHEHDELLESIIELDLFEKEELTNFLLYNFEDYIENNEQSLPYDVLIDDINAFIRDGIGQGFFDDTNDDIFRLMRENVVILEEGYQTA